MAAKDSSGFGSLHAPLLNRTVMALMTQSLWVSHLYRSDSLVPDHHAESTAGQISGSDLFDKNTTLDLTPKSVSTKSYY